MPTPLPFTWPFALVFWPIYIWAFIPEFHLIGKSPLTAATPPEDRGSLRVVFLALGIAIASAFVVAFAVPSALAHTHRIAWFALGLALLISGSLLRRHCFRTLGRFFTGAVSIQPDHRLITHGAYRWVRHPSYSGALLLLAGIGLSLGSWLSLSVLLLSGLAAYTYRARIEEAALLGSLGEPYRQFLLTRRRFIPWIY